MDGRNCKECGEFKQWSEYDKKKKGVNGRDSRCKACISEIRKKRRGAKRRSKSLQSKSTTVLVDPTEIIIVEHEDAKEPDSRSHIMRLISELVGEAIEENEYV